MVVIMRFERHKMNVSVGNTVQENGASQAEGASKAVIFQPSQFPHRITISPDAIVVTSLAIIALTARFILATQLDMVTDEVVYILGGQTYLPLLEHLRIGAQGWSYNYEHPPFVKLLIGLSLEGNHIFHQPLSELLATRLPSILFGTLLVVTIYLIGKAPFGRVIALLAALCLAVSPWLVYF